MSRRRPSVLPLLLVLCAGSSIHAQGQLRKIGEMDLAIVGVRAVVDPPRLTVPKNIATGVPITLRGGASDIAPGLLIQLLGGAYRVEGELSGPGLGETLTLRQDGPSDPLSAAPLLLPIPGLPVPGAYTLSNLRIMVGDRPVLDVLPRSVAIEVIDQVLITSVKTRPLTLQEIKDKGIVLDSDDYLAFEFTIGLKLESKAINLSFPVVFDRQGVALPESITGGPPMPSSDEHEIPVFPEIVPVMLRPPKPILVKINGQDQEVRIPSVLVIPGNVGYLKQFFSAQLFVANGAPALSGLTVRGVSGTMRLPAGADHVVGSPDDPLALAETANGIQPITMLIRGVGPDAAPGTSDDLETLVPGEQGQAEFLIRGDLEGFHTLNFDIAAVLEGLPTGPVNITGRATGGVLVRNPYFDMTFTVPSTVRKGERFKLFTSVTNIGQGLANDVSVTIDSSRLSGATIVGDATQRIDTLQAGDSKTVAFEFTSDRTGQVVASYLHLETQNGSTGKLMFTLGVGERGIVLSPDTLVLPAQVDLLPLPLVDAAMRVLGQAWSIANSAPGTLPAGVKRIGRDVVKQRALALAEAGLRVTLGEPLDDAIRNLIPDFAAGSSLDAGFDQLLRQTNAGQGFLASLGQALSAPAAAGPLEFERRFTEVAASGPEFVAVMVSSAGGGAPVNVAITDTLGRRSVAPVSLEPLPESQASGVAFVPLGPPASSPVFGLIASPGAGPYTLTLTAREAGPIDLSISLPRGDGTYARGRLTGFNLAAGSRAQVRINPGESAPLLVEYDADGSGTIDSHQALMGETVFTQGPQFVSATIVGPETLPAAGPYGFNVALLFDRVVDATAAADRNNYSMARNELRNARRQLSGRLVFGSLAQPEHTYLPATLTVAGLPDPRGVAGAGGTRPLRSLLRDPGAVVSGRILNPDGTPVVGATVSYSNNPNWKTCEAPQNNQTGFAAVQTDASGRYEFRYVRQDHCGFPWSMITQDAESGSIRSVSGYVRAAGEQIVLDIVLYGKGTLTGTVRDLTGNPVGAADVFAVSDTDPRIGHTTRSDGDGRFTIPDLLVGAIDVRAVKRTAAGSGATRIYRAGTTAHVDVTLDTGSVRVTGSVHKLDNGVTSPVAGSIVRYRLFDSSFPGGSRLVAIAGTKVDGSFEFESVPAGSFMIEASLDTGDRGTVSGVANAGASIAAQNIIIEVQRTARVSGVVRFPDGTPAAEVPVTVGDRGILTSADGTFDIRGVAVRPNAPQQVRAFTRDARRAGTTTIFVNSPGEHVSGVVVTLSGLGYAEFQVLNAAGQPLAGQEVMLLFTGESALAPSCGQGCGCALEVQRSDPNGFVTFANIPPGRAKARAMRFGGGLADVVEAVAIVPRDGETGRAILRFGGVGTIAGIVHDPDNRPAFGADIEVRSIHFNAETCSLRSGVSHRVRTGVDGRFQFSNINVGPVSLTVSQAFFPTQVAANGTLLRDGDHLSFDLKLVNTISGELSGTIFLPDGQTPAGAGVQVTAYGPLPDVTVTTNAEGRYVFAKIFPEGRYSLTVRDPVTGGVAQEQIYIKAAQDAVHDLRLKGRGTVRVRVVDGGGTPVSSAAVALEESSFPQRTYEGAVEAANEGVVTFANVFEGSFSVKASDVLGRGGRVYGTMPAPDAVVDVTVRLTVTGTVRGRFLMPDGVTPIPYASVKLTAGGRGLGQSVTRGGVDAGFYEFTYVPAGDVRIEASDPITARSGIGVGRIQTEGQELVLDIRAQGIGTVEGVVTSNGTPEPGAHVDIVSGSFKAGTYTGPDGRYIIVGVPEGLISATASLGGGAFAGTTSATLSGDGNTLTLDVALRSSGIVTGRVVKSDGTTPAPPSSVSIQVGGLGGGVQSITTDTAGLFRFDRVPAGLATVNVDVLGSLDQGKTTLDVVGDTTNDTTITLNGVGTLTGYARDSAGAPIEGDVTISGTGQFRYSFSVKSGVDGRFSIQQLLAGPVTVSLRATVNGLSLYGTSTGTVVPDATTELDVQLQDTGTVIGVVKRADGTPAPGTNVTLSLSGNRGAIHVQALGDGRFSASGVPLGGFTARFDDPSTGGVWRVLGRAIDENLEIEDLGTLTLDDTPVAVLSIDPTDGAAGVQPNHIVRLTFSDPLASTSGITIKTAAGGGVSASPVLSADGLVVTYAGTLPQSADLIVSVTTALTDIYGRHPAQAFSSHFRTADLSPPVVSAISPAHLTIQVAPSAAVQVTFNEPIAAANLQSIVALAGPGGGIAGTTALTAPNIVLFTPAAPLATDASYTVTVSGAIDLSGNQQSGTQIAVFKTLDTIAPVLALASPAADGWTKLPRPTIQVSAIDAVSGLNTSSISLTLDPGTPGAQTAAALVLVPASDLHDGTHEVSASVADLAGNVASLMKSFGVDTTAPTAALVTGFPDGERVQGTITIAATAADTTSGVASIALYRSGAFAATLAATLNPSSFEASLNTLSYSEGEHTFTARATDRAGNVGPDGPALRLIVNNRLLTVALTAPNAGAVAATSIVASATPSETVASVEFSVGSVTVVDDTAPYSVTLPLGDVLEGSAVVVTARAIGAFGETASASRTITVDRTPPMRPDAARINAEPPTNGAALVFGYAGAVDSSTLVEAVNLTNSATATTTATATGSFTLSIAGAPDELVSLTSVDAAGNRSTATVVAIRRTPSLPPITDATTLRYDGLLADRVSPAAGAAGLQADGQLDGVFTLSLSIGEGITRQLSYIDLVGVTTRSTRANIPVLAVATSATGTFLNNADGTVGFPVTGGTTLTLIAADAGFIKEGVTYTATAVFTDGARFVAKFELVPRTDRPQVAHTVRIAADATTLSVVSAAQPSTSVLTLDDFRDIDGTRVPDGVKVAISATHMASYNPAGKAIPSAGGTIGGGDPAPNNPNFRVFTIGNGMVTATYSSAPVLPASILGAMAVVQVLPADADGNVIGTEAIGTIDLTLRLSTDRAFATVSPTTLYADTGDRRATLRVRVLDASGNPLPDGSKVALNPAQRSFILNNQWNTPSTVGGTIHGGTTSPNGGANYQIFTVAGGEVTAEYSASGHNPTTGDTSKVNIQVVSADASGNISSNSIPLGVSTITLVSAASADVDIRPDRLPIVFPSMTSQIRVTHVHDSRGNVVPDGATLLITNDSGVTLALDACCWNSSNSSGSIVDGADAPNVGNDFRVFTLNGGAVDATYSPLATTLNAGDTVTTQIQVTPGNPAGGLLDRRAIAVKPLVLVGPSNAVGTATPSRVLADGAAHTATVRFSPILDAHGNPLRDGTKVLVSVASNVALNNTGTQWVPSAGGRILEGETSPTSSVYKVLTVQNGAVSMTYSSEGVYLNQGATATANVVLLEAGNNGERIYYNSLGIVPIQLAGVTSAAASASPSTLHGDGADRRSFITITNIRDAHGNLVPDDTLLGLTAQNNTALNSTGTQWLSSAGGSILGGTAPPNYYSWYRLFPVKNGQVVVEYSSAGASVSQGQTSAVIAVVTAHADGYIGEIKAIATATISLVAPASGTIEASPNSLLADDAGRQAQITLSNPIDSGGLPVPDGALIALTVTNNTALNNQGTQWQASAGGTLTSAGTSPNDGATAGGYANFQLFTVTGGQVRATYTATKTAAQGGGPLTAGVNETKVVTISAVPASGSGTVLTQRTFTVGNIFLRGTSSTTASGPTSMSRTANSSGETITFTGIKDSAGNAVPDGTLVVATVANNVTLNDTGTLWNSSAGGTITDGSASPSGANFKVFVVQGGAISLTYSPSGAATSNTVRVQLAPASADGKIINNRSLVGGVWVITLTQ